MFLLSKKKKWIETKAEDTFLLIEKNKKKHEANHE